jgi:hypothetical protein
VKPVAKSVRPTDDIIPDQFTLYRLLIPKHLHIGQIGGVDPREHLRLVLDVVVRPLKAVLIPDEVVGSEVLGDEQLIVVLDHPPVRPHVLEADIGIDEIAVLLVVDMPAVGFHGKRTIAVIEVLLRVCSFVE